MKKAALAFAALLLTAVLAGAVDLKTKPDWKTSPYTGYTRATWEEISQKIISGVMQRVDPQTGIFTFPISEGKYAETRDLTSEERIREMERIMIGVVTYYVGTGKDKVPGYKGSITQPFINAFIHGTDPNDPLYWGEPAKADQTGSGYILGLYMAPERFWDPLTDVQKSIRLYTQTKDSELVSGRLSEDLSGPKAFAARMNEIGELSDGFIGLMDEIDDHVANIEKMTEEAGRIGAELDLAARIQSAALPSTFPAFPDRGEFDLHASMDPAREVGGDLYDFFLIDDDHLCLVIADVSGKGVPAALFMMTTKAILNNTATLGRSPAEILRRTNDIICANNPENMFVTVWIGILELSTGRLVAANAGHEYPMLRRPGGQFELFRDKHGMALGCMEGMPYREYEIELEPGSKLFVYTDGVPEATDCDDVLFGLDRLLRALTSSQDAAPREILAAVRRDVDAFVGDIEQFDDLTMLCIEYKGT